MKVAKLNKYAQMPTRKHTTDAGIDLYTLMGVSESIPPHSARVVGTGITVEIPEGHFGFIHAKSGTDYLIGGGIVDQGYQGELLVKIINPLDIPVFIYDKKAIAQLLIIPCSLPEIEEVDLYDIHQQQTDRAATGGIVKQKG